jgi:hypothetical protein
MANFTNAPAEGVYRGTTTITLNGALLRPGQRLQRDDAPRLDPRRGPRASLRQ